MTHPTKQECTDPTGHCTCYSRQVYGKCCSCKAINPNPERAVVEGTIPSNEYLGLDREELRGIIRERDTEIEQLRPKAESWDSYEAAQERKAAMGLTDETSPRPKCEECKQEIDPDWCWCGDAIEDHKGMSHNHSPVRMGCTCGMRLPPLTQETYTNEAPSHPPILPERFNSVSLPENGKGD